MHLFIRLVKYLVVFSGLIFLIFILSAFTSIPFWAYYRLATSEIGFYKNPKILVLMGGGGFPGESNLIRAYYLQKAASAFPSSDMILALPGDTLDTTSTVIRMKNFLVRSGIDPSRLKIESNGNNTRAQVLNIGKMVNKNSALLVISSPEHMERCVLCFRKAGFLDVTGLPAFENAIESDLVVHNNQLGGRKIPGPGFSESTGLRYQFWTHLKYEVIVIREYFALAYYKLKGWI